MASITIKTDEELKKEFSLICEELGINISVAFNIFMKSVLREHGIPFELKLKEPNFETKQVLNDVLEGKNLSKTFSSVKELMEDLNA